MSFIQDIINFFNNLSVTWYIVGALLVATVVTILIWLLVRALLKKRLLRTHTPWMVVQGIVGMTVLVCGWIFLAEGRPLTYWHGADILTQIGIMVALPALLMPALELIPGIRIFRDGITVTEEVLIYLVLWGAFCLFMEPLELSFICFGVAGMLFMGAFKTTNKLNVVTKGSREECHNGGVEVGVPQFFGIPLPRMITTRVYLLTPWIEGITPILNGAHDQEWEFPVSAAYFKKGDANPDESTTGGIVKVFFAHTMFPDTSSGLSLRRLVFSGGMLASMKRMENQAGAATQAFASGQSFENLVSGRCQGPMVTAVIKHLTDSETGELHRKGSQDSYGYGLLIKKFVNLRVVGDGELQKAVDDVVEARIRGQAAVVTTEYFQQRARDLVAASEASGSKISYADALLQVQGQDGKAKIVGVGGDIPHALSALTQGIVDFIKSRAP